MLCTLVGVGFSALPAAAQPHYTYTVIADTSNCYNVAAPVIGNSGEVAFIANCDGKRVVRRGDGATLTDIYVHSFMQGAYSIPDSAVSINDLGTVAFAGGPTGGGSTGDTILYGDGGALTAVADTTVHTQWRSVRRPSINNSLQVAFGAQPAGATSLNTVIRADAPGSFTTIAQPGMVLPDGASTVNGASEAALNNMGQVEFLVNSTTVAGSGIYRGSGGPLTLITTEGSTFSGINDAGRVAFANGSAVRSGAGGALTTIAVPGSQFRNFGGTAAINNVNVVAFWAQLQAGGSGLFVGDGALTQPVIQTGDVLPGLGTVTWVGSTEEAINDAGQVAFVVRYDNGLTVKDAIIRADPILPEITALKLPGTVAGCLKSSATVTLDRRAPPGGVRVILEETNAAASTPASLTIPSNQTSGKFKVSTTPVAANEVGTVFATLGLSQRTAPLTVRPIGVKAITLSPNPATGGTGVTGTVTLECAAAPAAISVGLSSSNPVAQPQASSLVFPQGTKTMTFNISTSAVTATTTANISATANGITKKKALTVTP